MAEPDRKQKFRTHISEPRWQQVASIVLAVLLVGGWLLLFLLGDASGK